MKVLIELEFIDVPKEELTESMLKDSVYTFLTDLMENDSLEYTIEGEQWKNHCFTYLYWSH